jgi:serine/threonine protein kinase
MAEVASDIAGGGGPASALGDGDDVAFADDPEFEEQERKREKKRKALKTSGRMKALSSSSHNVKLQDTWGRRARQPEEDALALSNLEAQLAPAPEGDPYVGNDVGTFRVEGFLYVDRGIRTYLARDEASHEPVVLTLYPLKGGYGDEMKRLVERGERPCRVEHPGLSICLGSGKAKDSFYAAHEPPLGDTVGELIARGEVFDEEETLSMLEQLAPALGTLHGRQLMHGDISAHTVRRERTGSFVLLNTGLGRARPELAFLAAGGEVVGSPGFIAPETVDSGKVEGPAELYALGCVAWAMSSGHAPFQAEDPVQSLLDQLNQELPPVERPDDARPLSEGLRTVISKLGGYTPEDRYRNASELLQDLRRVRKGEAVQPPVSQAAPDSEPARVRVGRGSLAVILLLLIDAALVAVLVIKYLETSKPPPPDPLTGYQLPLPGISKGGFKSG